MKCLIFQTIKVTNPKVRKAITVYIMNNRCLYNDAYQIDEYIVYFKR